MLWGNGMIRQTLLRLAIGLMIVVSSQVLMAGGQVHAQTSEMKQTCEGVVAFDEDGMLQLMDVSDSASPWCTAYIGEDRSSKVAGDVLAQCPVGTRCIVEGSFTGRGIFFWTKIISAKRT